MSEWINIDTRLPNKGDDVLVFRPKAHKEPSCDKNIKICKYIDGNSFRDSYHNVTHWQPLPEIPKD